MTFGISSADIAPAGLDFVTLPSKVCVSTTEEDLIEAFSSNKDARSIKVVSDPVLSNSMRLHAEFKRRLGFERARQYLLLGDAVSES